MKQTASGWVILTRKLVAGFHPQNDTATETFTTPTLICGGRFETIVGPK